MKRIYMRIFFLALILIGIGFVMIFSSSSLYAQERHQDPFYFFKHQGISFVVGLVLQLMVIKFDYHRYKNMSGFFLVLSVVLLVMIFLPGIGHRVGGSRRWVGLGGLRFQPSEFVKIAMIIYFADYIDKKKNSIRYFLTGLLPALFAVSLVGGLILLQPDFGTTVLFCVVCLTLLFIGGARWSHLAILFLSALPLLYLAVWKIPYRRSRILSFLHPWDDRSGGGYQIIQSLIALGSGGLFGVGLGQSRQKMFYLPEAHTDFIFSIIGEELGLIGSVSILIIFCFLIWNGLVIVWNTKDTFGHYLGLGIVLLLSLQSIIHVGVVTGILPPKGITLPFISFGGSSLVMNMIAVGILINIGKQQKLSRVKRRM